MICWLAVNMTWSNSDAICGALPGGHGRRIRLSDAAMDYVKQWSSVVMTHRFSAIYDALWNSSLEVETLSEHPLLESENELG